VSTGAASQRQTAVAFGGNETTLWRWRSDYKAHRLIALLEEKKGPKRLSVLTGEKVDEIRQLRREGNKLREIASLTGVSLNGVQRATAGLFEDSTPPETTQGPLEPLAKPHERSAERWAAREGLTTEAKPVVCEGSHLPFAGALVVLPALVATGLVEAAEAVYGVGRHIGGGVRAAFYGIRALMLSIVFACLLGERRAEGMIRLDPVAIGRLIGLDRAPVLRRLRARMAELAVTSSTALRRSACCMSTAMSAPTTARASWRRPASPACASPCRPRWTPMSRTASATASSSGGRAWRAS
jgi:hypothetical protein